MTRSADSRLGAYAALAAAGLVAALAARRAELAVVAAPFAVLVALGVRRPAPALRAWFEIDRERALEGDELAATVTVRSQSGVDRVEVGVALPTGLELAEGRNPVALRLAPGEERELALRLRCTRWATVEVGEIWLRARDRIGLVHHEGRIDRRVPLKVYPTPERLRKLVSPAHTQAATGSEVAPLRAEGLEFADTRPFVPGDRVRSVNWRATARRGSLVVNDRHPERNADVVIFLDSFAEARETDEGTLEHAVRAAATLASRSLERRDRVGLVAFGGVLRWLEPGAGLVQRYRLVDALLETGVQFSYAWKDVNVIPARTLPPRALVIAVTPLLDERSVVALVDLRGRGHDLVLLEISPEPYVVLGSAATDAVALRLWRLQRAELRGRFERLGVAVATLEGDTSLETALEGVRAYRRHARPALR
ncbi:MAG TPA: DUF58 domain-containing protein [Gaiella sp.]|nr:DUF58 domain-containing protein [Gaiella sp.]